MKKPDSEASVTYFGHPERPGTVMERFFMHSPDLLATASIDDFAWKRTNPAFTRLLGWTESELLSKFFLDLVHPNDLDRSGLALADLAEGTPLTRFENRIRRKDGTYLWIAWEAWRDGAEGLIYGSGRNVSDRKRIEKHLLESEARYQALFNNMTEGFAVGEVILDGKGEPVDFRFIQINDAFSDQTGLDREVLNRPITEVLPEVEPHWIEKYGRVALTGKPATFENYNLDTDRHYQVYCYRPEKDRFAILFRDVTEEKHAEQIRRQSEALYRSLAANLPNGAAFVVNHQLRYLLAEGEALGHAGFQSTDFEGKTLAEALDSETATLYESKYRKALTGRSFSWEHESHGRHYITRGAPLRDESGRIFAALAVSYDVTENKRMEAALRNEQELFQTIFSSVPIMLTVYDPLLNMVHINQSLYDITGWTEAEMREHGIMDLVYPDPDYRQWVAEYMQSLSPGFQDIQMTCKDGRIRETAWANIHISDGRQVGIGIDMTERKELEESLRRLNKTLENQVAERTALAEARAEQLSSLAEELIEAEERERKRIAELLHDDLQQVLTGARMQLQTLSKRLSLTEELDSTRQLLADAVQKTRHLSHELSPAITHQDGLPGALEWLARNIYEQFGLEVRLKVETRPALKNASLGTFLYRAVHELLFNIIKHAGVKTADVFLSQEDGRLTIAVCDKGAGFDPDLMDSSDARIGLGLVSLRERTRYFGGILEIDSAPGKGSRFILHIPNTANS